MLPLLPLACSVGDIQINQSISNTLDQLYQTRMFSTKKRTLIDSVKLLWCNLYCEKRYINILLLYPFTFSASTDLTESGITLARNPDSKAVSRSDSCMHCFFKLFCLVCITMPFSSLLLQPSLQDFQAAFSVVFVDPSGHLNLLADMTAFTYKQVSSDLVSI